MPKKKGQNGRDPSNHDLSKQIGSLEKTVESLARSTAQGFAEVQKQADHRFQSTIERFEKLEADMGDVKRALGPMVQMMAMNDHEIGSLKLRLNRVERKVGIK